MRDQGKKCPKYQRCGCMQNKCPHEKCEMKGGTCLALTDNYFLEEVPSCFREPFYFVRGCSEKCPCDPSTCTKNILKNAKTPPMTVFYEPNISGFGVRDLTDIKKGQFITNYAGEVLVYRETKSQPVHKNCDYIYEMENSFSIDAVRYGNEARFFSHSCGPNLFSVRLFSPGQMDRLIFFANRDIEAGEELSIDYHPDCYTMDCRYNNFLPFFF